MSNDEKINILLEQLKHDMPIEMRIDKLNLLRILSYDDDRTELFKSTCRALIKILNNSLYKMNGDKLKKYYTLLRDVHTQFGRYDLESYLIAMEWDRKPEKRFYQPRMKVLAPVVRDLQDLGDGVIDVYVLSMPPRVGKSTLGLFFISWLTGRYPFEHIFAAGYASGLVETFYKAVYDFISSDEYRFYEIFPEANGKLTTSIKNMTIDIANDERYKSMTYRSIDGQITGAVEAESLLYMDDMCSGIEEAMSRDRLDKLWSKVSVNLMQRRIINKRTGRLAPILAIGTVWSLHDPISRLKRAYKDDPRFRERIMPALDNNDESNFNYDYGLGFTSEAYIDLRKNMDEVSWECVYQQNPMERDGLMFPNSELRRYLSLPKDEPDKIVAWCDVAFGGSDYLCFPIGYQYGDDVYIPDVVFKCRADYKVTEPIISGKIIRHGVQMARFEANNGGDFFARDVSDYVRQNSTHTCNITWSRAPSTKSKLARIEQYAPDIKNFYFKDSSLYSVKSDYGQMMQQLTTFLSTGQSPHDDAPDGLAGLASITKEPMTGLITSPFKRPF